MEQAIHFISEVLKLTFFQFFIVLGPFLIIAFLLHFVSGWFKGVLYLLAGERFYHIFFGKLSIIIHEFGHALFCFIFRQKVNNIDLSRENAHVDHSYSPDNAFQLVGQFFIGLGPILLSIFILYLSAYMLFKESILMPFIDLEISYLDFESMESVSRLLSISMKTFFVALKNFFTLSNWISWKFYLFLYILIIAGDSIQLSKSDVGGFLIGSLVFVAYFLIVSIYFQITGNPDIHWLFSITRYYSSFISVMLLCLLFNATLIIPLFLLTMLKKILFRSLYSQYP